MITFSCLGFSTCSVFLEDKGVHHHIGFIAKELNGIYTFDRFGMYKKKIPAAEKIIAEYEKQYKKYGVVINNKYEAG